MKCKFILGTDVSKAWLNFCLMNQALQIIGEWQIDNEQQAIIEFLDQLCQLDRVEDLSQIWIVMEHTGIYVQHLVHCASSKDVRVSLVAASKISDSLVGKASFEQKTDQIDARRIAEYGHRFEDKLILYQPPKENMLLIKRLYKQRERLLNVKKILTVPVNETKQFDPISISSQLEENQKLSIKAIQNSLKKIEKQLEQLLNQDACFKQQIAQMVSVEGIGKVTATAILLATEAFIKFQPNQAKAFNNFIGAAPLEKQSGIKNRKRKTPKRSKVDLKSVLTMGALSLINTNSELGKYYRRKIKEGKHHLSVINAMRNKMILRVFAVIRNGTIYQKNLNICLDKP